MAAQEVGCKLFADAPHSWDDRLNKGNSSVPELMQRAAKEAMRNDGRWNPPWLESEASSLKQNDEGAYRGVRAALPQVSTQNCGASNVNCFRTTRSNGFLSSYVSVGFLKSCYEGRLREALSAVDSMGHQQVSTSAFFHLLQRCIEEKDVVAAREVHRRLVRSGVDSDAFLMTHLIRMFAALESLSEAKKIFSKVSNPTVFSWSAIISAHAKLGEAYQALELYDQMLNSTVEPDGYVFVAVLKACAATAALTNGKRIHAHTIQRGLDSDIIVGNCLVDMYAKCGSIQKADTVFHKLPRQDVVTWNALIAGYANHGHGHEALQLFKQMQLDSMEPIHNMVNKPTLQQFQKMQQEGMEPNAATFIYILKACSKVGEASEQGKLVHSHILERGFESDMSVVNTLIDMYGKCGRLGDAFLVFERLPKRDVVTWSVLIAGYSQHGQCWKALELFQTMLQESIEPDQATFVCILKACSSIAALEPGKHVHNQITESGYEMDLFVSSTLIDMYNKCKCLQDARTVFNGLPIRGIVTWNAMISGYAQHGHGQEALELFNLMQREGIDPDQATYVSVLQACSNLFALEQGEEIHVHIIENGFESDVFINTTLIDMYNECGTLEDARLIFDKSSKRDVVTWNAMIAAFARHNNYQLAVNCFEDMQQAGWKPNDVTFICILSACSHAGLVDEGCLHFKSMRENFGIAPTFEHYDSMVDLFGHAGCLQEAEDLLETVPFAPNIMKWTSLLSSCRTYGNVDIGKRCFDRFVTMDRRNAAGYVLMSNIYAHAGMQQDAEKVEELRKCANGWKKPARAFIEVDRQVHYFTVGDKTHPRIDDIYAKLKSLSTRMAEEGYMPRLDLVISPISDEDKENSLCGHCEKLAIAFGLICTPRGTTLRVAKNLRVCADCHMATKIISKFEVREIVIIDAYRTHHFKEGDCSCKDTY